MIQNQQSYKQNNRSVFGGKLSEQLTNKNNLMNNNGKLEPLSVSMKTPVNGIENNLQIQIP